MCRSSAAVRTRSKLCIESTTLSSSSELSESATCSGRRVEAGGDLGQAHPRPPAARAVVDQHAHDRAVQSDVRVVRVRDRADRVHGSNVRGVPDGTPVSASPRGGAAHGRGPLLVLRRGRGLGSPDHSLGRSSGGRGSVQLGPSIVERRHGTQTGRGAAGASAGSGAAWRRSVRATSAAASANASAISGSVRSRPPSGLVWARPATPPRRGMSTPPEPPPSRPLVVAAGAAAGPLLAALGLAAGLDRGGGVRCGGRDARRRDGLHGRGAGALPRQRPQAGEAGALEPGDAADADVEPPGDAAARARARRADAGAQREHAALSGGEVVEAATGGGDGRAQDAVAALELALGGAAALGGRRRA